MTSFSIRRSMAKNSIHELLLQETLENLQKKISEKYYEIILAFVSSYRQALKEALDEAIPTILLFLQLVEPQFSTPFVFEPYHRKVRHPIDYYRFALDFIRPLVDIPRSAMLGLEHFKQAVDVLKRGDNVILLANHQ